jgi:transposase
MTDATSIVPTQVLSGMLSPTAMLFGLEEEFSVLTVDRCGPFAVKVIIEQIARDGPCPDCGVLSSVVKDRPMIRVKDLPVSGQAVQLWWRKRRFRCGEDRCPRRSFTQTAAAVRPRGRLTERLRDKLASAIAGSKRSVAAHWLLEPEPTAMLGIDETRFGSVRWLLDRITWRRPDPCMTSFVDCTPGRLGSDPGEDRQLDVVPASPGVPIDQLGFRAAEERFCHRVVKAVTD